MVDILDQQRPVAGNFRLKEKPRSEASSIRRPGASAWQKRYLAELCAFRTYRHACAGGGALSPFGNEDGDASHAAALDTALLILDFQVGVGDQPYAKSAAQRAAAALKIERVAGLPVVFSKVKFRAGYRDVADSDKAFALINMKNLFPPDESKLISILQPDTMRLL